MRVVVIGSGAREHALVVALARGPEVTALACGPGNPGIVRVAEPLAVHAHDPASVLGAVSEWGADLVVIGPEAPLVAGVADAVRDAGIPCFGPSAAAARIESSKAFAKDIMSEAGVPTAHSVRVDNPARLDAVLDGFGERVAVKDDGLAGGKGVLVTADRAEARKHAVTLLEEGHPILIESYLDGPEVSLFCLVDGETVRPLLPAQDFKRAGDGGCGPNTGGMGAYCPLPWAPPGLAADVAERIVRPTVAALAARGTPFTGLLYAGLALTADGPQVIEFNCRFGDPETQVVLPLLRTPLAGALLATARGELAALPPLEWETGAAVAVVLAADGYPSTARTGDVITGSDAEGVLHAGTVRRADGAVVSAGGRVLSVVGTGADLTAARAHAYERLGAIHLPGAHYRTDIARDAELGEIALPVTSC